MKTTIELPDELAKQARRVARQESASFRALVEEGLQRSLDARRQAAPRQRRYADQQCRGLPGA